MLFVLYIVICFIYIDIHINYSLRNSFYHIVTIRHVIKAIIILHIMTRKAEYIST